MPIYARDSDMDLNDVYMGYLKGDSEAHRRRNIRTKTIMHNAHHCEDKEHGGAPNSQCIPKLHIAFCPAPVIDKDPESDTYGQVIICGERFKVISPKGCAEHPYSEGFNLDLKNARNDRPNFEIEHKKIFEDFKVEHAEELARMAKKREALQKRANMSEPQKQRLRARQDQVAYDKASQLEATRRRDLIPEGRFDEILKDREHGEYPLKGPGVPLAYNSRESKLGGGYGGQRGIGISQSSTPLGPLGSGFGHDRSGSCQPVASPASILGGLATTSHLSKNQLSTTLLPTSKSFAISGGSGNGQPPAFSGPPSTGTAEMTTIGRGGTVLNTSLCDRTYMVSSAAQYGDLSNSSLGSIDSALREDQSQKAPPRHGSTSAVSQHPGTAHLLLDGLAQPPDSEEHGPPKVVESTVPDAPEQSRRVTRAAEAFLRAPPRRKEAKEAKKLRAAGGRAAAMTEAAEQAKKVAEEKAAAEEAAAVASIQNEKSAKGGKTGRGGKTIGNGRRRR